MVSKIDTAAVCGHFNGALAGIIPHSGITKAVGLLINQSPSNYVDTVQEIGTVFHNAIQGNFLIDPSEIPHLSFSQDDEYLDWDGNPVKGNHYDLDWINTCLHLDRTPETLKLWAGFTNLKSAAAIEQLSRQEKSEQRESITHTVTVNRQTRREWKRFLDKFIPKLVKELSLDGKREYDILRSIPLSGKASRFVNDKGQLMPCKRGDRDFSNLSQMLKHPVVNRLFRQYPNDAIAATMVGQDATVGELNEFMPDPYPYELPVGAVVVVPKDAQKPRTVYILVGVLDSMSRPMFHKLEEIESRWNIQGVMDQDGARRHVSQVIRRNNRLKHPKQIFSYDQSAFTDNFSYDFIQRPVVEALIKENILKEYDLALLDEINHGEWDAQALGLKFETISFGTGTGMGTPPSFPLASITNGLMVAFAYYKAYGNLPDPTGHNPPGLVVGDDCVIFDEKVAHYYEQFCSDIGLKVNLNKSFHNSHVAEFCGKYITDSDIFSKRKLIYPSCVEAVTDFLDYYQDKADDYFRAYPQLDDLDMTKVLARIREVPRPFGVGRPVEDINLQTATSVEMIASIAYNASKVSDYVLPDLKGSRKDVRVAIRRSAELLPIADVIRLVQQDSDHKEPPKTNILVASLARDVQELDSQLTTSSTWEQLYQVASEVSAKVAEIKRLQPVSPGYDRVPTLTPRKSDALTRLEQFIGLPIDDGDSNRDDPDFEMGS